MKLYIILTILVAIILELVRVAVTSSLLSCPSGYNHCDNSIWCCPDGYVCTGTSTCLSIGTIVGAVIGSLVGLAVLIGLIIFCCRYQKRTRNPAGTVFQPQPVVYNTGAQQQYGQQPQYGQPQYGMQPNTGYGQANSGYQPPPPQTK